MNMNKLIIKPMRDGDRNLALHDEHGNVLPNQSSLQIVSEPGCLNRAIVAFDIYKGGPVELKGFEEAE